MSQASGIAIIYRGRHDAARCAPLPPAIFTGADDGEVFGRKLIEVGQILNRRHAIAEEPLVGRKARGAPAVVDAGRVDADQADMAF